jgi:hypothetical protein
MVNSCKEITITRDGIYIDGQKLEEKVFSFQFNARKDVRHISIGYYKMSSKTDFIFNSNGLDIETDTIEWLFED